MYLFHSSSDYTLVNKNADDLLGTAARLCRDISSKDRDSLLLSSLSVDVDTAWGTVSDIPLEQGLANRS